MPRQRVRIASGRATEGKRVRLYLPPQQTARNLVHNLVPTLIKNGSKPSHSPEGWYVHVRRINAAYLTLSPSLVTLLLTPSRQLAQCIAAGGIQAWKGVFRAQSSGISTQHSLRVRHPSAIGGKHQSSFQGLTAAG